MRYWLCKLLHRKHFTEFATLRPRRGQVAWICFKCRQKGYR